MHLEEVISTPTTDYKIFCDLDGVLVNFDKFARDHIGVRPEDWQDKGVKRDFWRKVNIRVKEGKPFYGAMEPMPDATALWGHIAKYHPTILSATGHIRTAKEEKREWVNTHLGGTAAGMAIFVLAAGDKAQYAAPAHVLIDDREKAINPWIEAGGIGILHTDAQSTIRHLKELGL